MKKNSGFSLIELLVVLGIIGVLSSIVTPKFKNYLAKGKEVKAIATLESLRTASEFYYLDNGESFIKNAECGEITPAQLKELESYLSNNLNKLIKNNKVVVEIGGKKKNGGDSHENIIYGGEIGFTTKNPNPHGESNGVNIWFDPEDKNDCNMKDEKWIEL